MNKAKIMLSAIAAVAAIGGAFALKSKKMAGIPLYGITTYNPSQPQQICNKYIGFGGFTTPSLSNKFYFVSVSTGDANNCTRQYYTFSEI